MTNENNEKVITPRDYTIIELRQQKEKAARQSFWHGMLVDVVAGIIVTLLWQGCAQML